MVQSQGVLPLWVCCTSASVWPPFFCLELPENLSTNSVVWLQDRLDADFCHLTAGWLQSLKHREKWLLYVVASRISPRLLAKLTLKDSLFYEWTKKFQFCRKLMPEIHNDGSKTHKKYKPDTFTKPNVHWNSLKDSLVSSLTWTKH